VCSAGNPRTQRALKLLRSLVGSIHIARRIEDVGIQGQRIRRSEKVSLLNGSTF
jgi:hypothetical protein